MLPALTGSDRSAEVGLSPADAGECSWCRREEPCECGDGPCRCSCGDCGRDVLRPDAIIAADWPFEHLGETRARNGGWPVFFGNVADAKPPIDDQRGRR